MASPSEDDGEDGDHRERDVRSELRWASCTQKFQELVPSETRLAYDGSQGTSRDLMEVRDDDHSWSVPGRTAQLDMTASLRYGNETRSVESPDDLTRG